MRKFEHAEKFDHHLRHEEDKFKHYYHSEHRELRDLEKLNKKRAEFQYEKSQEFE